MEARDRHDSDPAHDRRREPGSGWWATRGHSERGAILVEYGMVLVAILIVSIALIQFIGGRVVEMFEFVIPGFG